MDNNNQFSNIMNIANLITSFAPSKPATASDNASWRMFPIDAHIHTEPVRICKCLIPYLPYERQKSLSVALKVFELMSVFNYYSDPETINNAMRNPRENEAWQTDLLHSIRHNLDPNHAYLVDIFFKINDVRKILSAVQSGSYSSPASNPTTPLIPNTPTPTSTPTTTQANSETPNDVIQKLSPLLDENQRNMLKMLSTIMK